MRLPELIPDVETVLSLSKEELGGAILHCRNTDGSTQFHMTSIHSECFERHVQSVYPREHSDVLRIALGEALQWLQAQSLIVEKDAMNAGSGWMRVSRLGAAITSQEEFRRFREATLLPKDLVHPLIRNRVVADFGRGDYATAVFEAFKAVEIEIRSAGKFSEGDYGTPMARQAFKSPDGPLTDAAALPAEQEALAHLVAGAIGSYKNPRSHRNVPVNEPGEAIEMIFLASHILRIIDSRRPE